MVSGLSSSSIDSMRFRPRLMWRTLTGAIALLGLFVVVSEGRWAEWLVWVSLAVWTWVQKLEVIDDRLRGRWRLRRDPVDLSDLVRVEVYLQKFTRVVQLEDAKGNLTRFTLVWWQRPYDLLELIAGHLAVGVDEDGFPTWKIEMSESTESLLRTALDRA